MKKWFLVTVLLTISLSNAFSQELSAINETVFKTGEQLSYKFKYGFFTGAEATLRVEDGEKKIEGHPTYHIIADGKTAGTFDIFYKVRNRYETYVDRTTLSPYFYTENRREGGYRHSDNVTFDHENNKITANKGVFPFKGKVFDFVSAYYFARKIDISKIRIGEKFNMEYFLEDGIHTLSITYIGKEKADCGLGEFNCLKFNPTIIPGRIFRKDSKLYLWITDDNNRIPIKAHVELIVGSVTMELTDAKGLKYPLNPIK
ncbi:MAG: ATP-dependent exodnase [Mucilaginibacter sp.]|nr:ATP-dependent exodnase [Mucilaginibacter sp.]